MGNFNVKVSGKNVVDKMNRQEALEKIDNHASTDALMLLAQIMEEKPGASEKFVQNGAILKSFI
ncbi:MULTISPECIES: hypothetical protein [unclassified Tenacibaculum]|uniref:hypothetical protein n=1 Tax=unclassified Tenacibaculum TaxID=2635139 RepID=UPI001F2AD932|nr:MULTISPECIES: hypothetical protein [unclassified Tenacibaculum]MCF2875427.1 hypothetical protein [Tenacibaculum sp. Cn5-1]MCF2935503.1 hypothetical protein [Tenacibaculum sp. Cn5-34]MCG7512063.1 hypothetical protein [Tenacibaculum sp. Cn5-46]